MKIIYFCFVIIFFPLYAEDQIKQPKNYSDSSEKNTADTQDDDVFNLIDKQDDTAHTLQKEETIELQDEELKLDKKAKDAENNHCIVEAEYLNLCILDKNTGSRNVYKMYVDDVIHYADFEIILKKCVSNINPFNNDDLGLFEIYRYKDKKRELVFHDWISKNYAYKNSVTKTPILLTILNCYVR